MTRHVAALALALTAVVPAGAAHAGPPVDGPIGALCGFVSVTDPGNLGGNVQTGAIFGGPVLAVDSGLGIQSGTLKCTIQIGGSLHSSPDNGASASANGTGVVVLPPTLVSFIAPANISVYYCTQFTYTGGYTIYWHASDDPLVDGHWTSDPNKACSLATEFGTSDTDPIVGAVIDIVCPPLDCDYTGLDLARAYIGVPPVYLG
jgi:hypothetical protein